MIPAAGAGIDETAAEKRVKCERVPAGEGCLIEGRTSSGRVLRATGSEGMTYACTEQLSGTQMIVSSATSGGLVVERGLPCRVKSFKHAIVFIHMVR